MYKSVVLSTGSYLPKKIVTNHDLAKTIDTSHEWIHTRTGIDERHIAAEGELTSDMAAFAAEKAIEKAQIKREDIDLIIVATTTPDKTFPATAVITQALLKVPNAAAFDIQAVCSGFVYALTIADGMIKAGSAKNALVIGADKMSSIVNWQDRGTCILFGDGAGAVLLTAAPQAEKRGIISHEIFSDGNLANILYTSGGVGANQCAGHVVMEGKEVFKNAVEKMSASMASVVDKVGLTAADIDWVVPHQANVRIINSIAKRLDIADDKFVLTVDKHANTSAASIPLALDHACGQFKKNDTILMSAAGGGFTWGSLLLTW